MIYLTETRTASTEVASFMDGICYPQQVHWFPDTYSRVKTGMVYVPHKMAEKVDRKSTRLNSSHIPLSRMPSSA